jgi:hypothetical protein
MESLINTIAKLVVIFARGIRKIKSLKTEIQWLHFSSKTNGY